MSVYFSGYTHNKSHPRNSIHPQGNHGLIEKFHICADHSGGVVCLKTGLHVVEQQSDVVCFDQQHCCCSDAETCESTWQRVLVN